MMDNFTDHKQSVKRADFGPDATGGSFIFWIPYSPNNMTKLPPVLPDPATDYFGMYPNERDKVLLSTMNFESFWAGSVGIVASKTAAAGWTLKSDKPRIQNRFQDILLNSTVGPLSGWVPFVSAGVSSFANVGKWIVEIERYTKNRNSRIKAFHHLSPRRCWITTDPERPVIYMDKMGGEHVLRSHQVMIFVDMPDTEEMTINSPTSAAVRAYDAILQLSTLKWYLYEKMSGRTPLAFHFLQGISDKTLETAITNAENEQNAKGARAYMGAVLSAIMGDSQLNLVTVPLAEIPDGVDVDQIRKYAHLEYSNALGEDPTRLDPQLIGNRQLGGGTQAKFLDLKTRQGGLQVVLKQDFTHEVMQLLRDEKITFSFDEIDLLDDQARADVSKTRAETRKIQVESGEIDTTQAANLAVDAGDLPPEFLETDETLTDVITDADQPVDKIETDIESDDIPEMLEDDLGITEKQIDPNNLDEINELLTAQYPESVAIYEGLRNG